MWSAAWAWAVLTIGIVLYVVVFDLHALWVHGQTMSGKFHDWMFDTDIGPIVFGVWVGIFVALTFHWFQYKGK
jgi:hypothetical protein